MNEQNPYNSSEEYEYYEDEEQPIDWSKYIGRFLRNWKRIFIISFAFGVLGIGIALMQKRQYKVSVTLAPEVQSNRSTSSSLSNLASIFGVNMGASGLAADALNITLFPQILSSTPFLTQLFEVELSPNPQLPKNPVEARKVLEEPQPTVKLFDHLTGRDREKSWMRKLKESVFGPPIENPDYLKVNVSRLTKEQSGVVKRLSKMISATVDKKTAMTSITVSMDDPQMCAQLADTVCRRLREYVFAYRTEKELQNFNYYESLCDSTYRVMVDAQAAYAASIDNNQSLVLQSVAIRRERLQQEASIASQIYQQMVQQREISRARLQQMKPVFAVVQPSVFPQSASNSRTQVVLLWGIFGFLLTTVWYVFGKDYYQTARTRLKELLKASAE